MQKELDKINRFKQSSISASFACSSSKSVRSPSKPSSTSASISLIRRERSPIYTQSSSTNIRDSTEDDFDEVQFHVSPSQSQSKESNISNEQAIDNEHYLKVLNFQLFKLIYILFIQVFILI